MIGIGPGLLLMLLVMILAVSLFLRDTPFMALCNVLSGVGAVGLLGGLALVGQKLLDWPAQPLANPAAYNGPAAWIIGCVLILYGSVVLGLGLVLRQLLRHVR